ncbi:MAG: type II toxin-antitoxin system prevent-host-death family antitoxin [Thiolinea sp.]
MQANEVKAQLSEVLRKVENGEEVLISRHGKIVARLLPWNSRKQKIMSRLEAIEALQNFRRIPLEKGKPLQT